MPKNSTGKLTPPSENIKISKKTLKKSPNIDNSLASFQENRQNNNSIDDVLAQMSPVFGQTAQKPADPAPDKKKFATANEVFLQNQRTMKLNANKKQVNGQLEREYQKTTIDQVLGNKGIGVYPTLDESEYLIQMRGMNKYDLIQHAVNLGVFPHDNRDRLERELIKAFQIYASQFKIPKNPVAADRPVSKELHDLLSRAK